MSEIDTAHPSSYERERLATLRQLKLLDTSPSESFDRITRMAARLFDLPIAAVSLTDEDRQWFKSRVGVDHFEIPRERACCGEVADTTRLLVVDDLLESPMYRDSVLARSGIRFYAGAPLMTRDGYSLGAMCVLGTEPRKATAEELAALQDLAAMVMDQIELQHAFGRIDPTTGLPNRNQFSDDLQDLARDEPDSHRFAVFIELLDVEHLSLVQRTIGPASLDLLSRAAAQQLSDSLQAGAALYQLGNCQFVLLCSAPDERTMMQIALDLRSELIRLSQKQITAVTVRPALGITPFRAGSAASSDILRTAHSACLDARETESGVGLFSVSLDAGHQRRFALIGDTLQALASETQFRLVFQPRIDSRTERCVGAEALLRWSHPTLGEVSPAEFIPLIEETPLARPLTGWVLRQAVAQAARWHAEGLGLRISVNISAANLDEADFAERLLAIMAEVRLPSSALELELTESALIGNSRCATAQLEAVQKHGVTVAIDDFGTGYSSLAYLQEIPAQVVKIDRSFVSRLEDHKRSQTLVRGMVSMAHEMGYSVVAEGIETVASQRFLQDLGCDEMQVYLIGRPMAADAFSSWLAERSHQASGH